MKQLTLAAAMLATVAGLPAAASATAWGAHHPRQSEVLGRVHRQDRRITQERREGEITGAQAHALRADDHAIAMQDHADSRANGGYITKGEQHTLNKELNANSQAIAH